MTGGRIVVLGSTGLNFAAGMSGGVAYVLDTEGEMDTRTNHDLVDLEDVDAADGENLRGLIAEHAELTGSERAHAILADWDLALSSFVRVMPRDYRLVLEAHDRAPARTRVHGETDEFLAQTHETAEAGVGAVS